MTASSWGTKGEPKFADSDAPDLAVNPTQAAAYAAKVGNRRVGITAERLAATGVDVWEGLLWGDTTDGTDYKYGSGAWIPLVGVALLASASPVTTSTPAVGAYGLVASLTFTTTVPRRVEIVAAMIAQSSGVSAGFVRVKLNGVDLGIPRRFTNLGQANAPVGLEKVVKGVTLAGSNTIRVEGAAETTIWFANSPTIEVWAC